MFGPSSKVSKLLLFLLFLLVIFYIFMDIQLYFRIQNYHIDGNYQYNTTLKASTDGSVIYNTYEESFEKNTWLPCDLHPLCHITVKAVLLDHTNHYFFAVFAAAFDNIAGLSKSPFITANMISFFHVGVACVAGKFVSSNSLGYRRFGVILFQFRTFLDDLDGHVARAKKNIHGERSEVGTSGYYIDGICDGLGCIALLIGIFVFLKNNPPRRGYSQVPLNEYALPEPATKHKSKTAVRKITKKVMFFAAQLLLSSSAWNRYIAVYQDMLERSNITYEQYIREMTVFKSMWFFCIAWLWRIFNVHSLLHFVLLSIFCDKLWNFLKAVQYSGFVILLIIICATEMHVLDAHHFIFSSEVNNNSSL